MLVHLLPLGRDRFALYAEPPDQDDDPPGHDAGRVRRWLHSAVESWRGLVDRARLSTETSGLAAWRDAVIRRLADSIQSQRTMWSLRTASQATLLYPARLDPARVRATLRQLLAGAQRHHGQWLIVYLLLFILSGVLFFVPGPNIVAYYLGFRTFGHVQSWRGARQASSRLTWELQANDDLDELAALSGESHEARADRVREIAGRLHLEHLPAFFEHAAA